MERPSLWLALLESLGVSNTALVVAENADLKVSRSGHNLKRVLDATGQPIERS